MAPFVVGSQKPNARDNTTPLEQRLGQATSVVIPLLELGALGFATWVLCFQICIQYIIQPSIELQDNFGVRPRRGIGIALIVIHAILLLSLLIPWFRLLQVIWSRNDIMPIGNTSLEKKDVDMRQMQSYDAYVSDFEGYPLFCEKCHIFKPDRTHHCKELGRCVRKMDHYCPWAGGIIAESSHKFFMQFVFYAALFTTFVWLVVAIFLAERSSKTGDRPGTWIGALATALMFCIFTTTMSGMTGYNLAINYTSVEAIQRGGISMIAFRISSTSDKFPAPSNGHVSSASGSQSSDPEKDWPVIRVVEFSQRRKYVVMQAKPFEHAWSTSLMEGWKDTMGEGLLEWLLPFKMSPCKKRTRAGEYRWGEVVYDMARKYEADNPGVRLALLR